MKTNDKKKIIKCNVESCKNNDCTNGICILKSVEISCNCPKDKCSCTAETICKSFDIKK